MSHIIDTTEITQGALTFRVEIIHDEDQSRPWENADGHGPVRESSVRHSRGYDSGKRPGERPLNDPDRNQYQFFYDWQAAVATARTEWGISDDKVTELTNKLGRLPTAGECAVAAAEADFQFLRAWCNDEWVYVGVRVTLLERNEDDELVEAEGGTHTSDSLWGVEFWQYQSITSEDNAYVLDVANEMANSIGTDHLEEQAERGYWNARDVETR